MAQHKSEALEIALNRALNSAAQAKRKRSPEEYGEQLLQFLNALLGGAPRREPQ
jgi:hypothetical protein